MAEDTKAATATATDTTTTTTAADTTKAATTTQATDTTKATDTTIAGTGGADTKTATTDTTKTATDTTATADWRAKLAGDDKDLLKTLARYTDEAAFGKAHRALLVKMSSGELKKALPEGATPEETAAWRKENGLPDKPEAYVEKLELPKGMVIGEADKPIVAEFAKAALNGNVEQKQFNGMVAKYYEILDAQKAKQEDDDAAFRQASEDDLRKDWTGPDYRRNLAAIQNLMGSWPEGLATRVLAGRTPDGRKLGDDPAFVRQLAALARELNPAATLLPAGTGDTAKGLADRINELKGMMGDQQSAYWKGPTANALQQEYRDLIDAQNQTKARAA